jgi:hypothetical protein
VFVRFQNTYELIDTYEFELLDTTKVSEIYASNADIVSNIDDLAIHIQC